MKIFLLLLVFALPLQWQPDFETAKKTAKDNHELILLNFSGSDWCGPCIVFRRDYLENDVFAKMATDNLILVNADFPRKQKNMPSATIIKQNEALAEIYNKQGAFPLTLLLDADGKVLKTWHGKPEMSAEEWTSQIKTICDAQK